MKLSPSTSRRSLAACVLVCSLAGQVFAASAARPNLVIMLSDDHSLLDSTVYGAKDVRTPNMERIAAAGLTFDRAFVASPTCAPSRAALLTGLMPAHNGAEANHSKPRPEIKKLPAYLQDLGYEVVAFGKVAHYQQTADYGFDYFAHITFHDDAAVAEAVKWLRARQSAKPLCLFVGTNWPHVPWPEGSTGFDKAKIIIPPEHVDTPTTREMRARYYAGIERMDSDLGAIFDATNAILGRNTFFLHSSDNGAQWPFAKWTCYEAGVRTPMIAVWPGKLAVGIRTAAMVSWIDILPTLVDVAGGSPPADIDGRSFGPVLRGQRTTHRDRIFTTHSADGKMNLYPSRALHTEGWHYIRNLHPEFKFTTHIDLGKPVDGAGYFASWTEAAKTSPAAASAVRRYHERPPEELYDLRVDRAELHNLAGDPRRTERLAAMRAEVATWMKAQGDTGRVFGEPRFLKPTSGESSQPE